MKSEKAKEIKAKEIKAKATKYVPPKPAKNALAAKKGKGMKGMSHAY